MFVCGGTPCTGSAFCATPSLRDKIDNNNDNTAHLTLYGIYSTDFRFDPPTHKPTKCSV